MNKSYLGDAVYAEMEHGMIKLTVEDGQWPRPVIFLEPEVFASLLQWAKSQGWKVTPE
jgi:hypothetical protein